MKSHQVLFISYDGMTDPLGQSQVLPYLIGLSQKGFHITILSCEKKDRFIKFRQDILDLISPFGIQWQHVFFSSRPPVLSKYYDLIRLKSKAVALHKTKSFDLVHCRSYVSADIGLYLKKKFGIKLLFDMRGFWVDERVDGGAWNLKHPMYRIAYRNYKKKEAAYIKAADSIISLTEAGKKEIQTWKSYTDTFIEVIPCSTDFDLFEVVDPAKKKAARQQLGISMDALVFSYLGSIGAWYMLDEMLQFFGEAKKAYPGALFLFVTAEDPLQVIEAGKKHHIKESDILIYSAKRTEVPFYIAASDINVFFIKQSYSKIASSPTKLGEILAMGLPVICNSKVGDVKEIVEQTESGIVIDNFTEIELKRAVEHIPVLIQKEPEEIRANATDYYKLEHAVDKYANVYKQLLEADVLMDNSSNAR